MTYRRLSNGVELPAIGLGSFLLKDELSAVVPQAHAMGYRLVDTSDNYGNEKFVGKGLAACAGNGRDVVVVTKFSRPARTDSLKRAFEESAARLGRVDVYLLHWPYPFLWKRQWRKMEDLYFAGHCRAIGVCNFDADRLRELLSFCRVRPQIDQFERHPLFQQAETAAFCRAQGIQVMSYSPFARMDGRLMRHPVLVEMATRYGRSVGQVILQWNVEHGDIPIPASRSEAHLRENLASTAFSLSEEDMAVIDGLECGQRVRFDPATRFSRVQRVKFLYYWFRGAMKNA